jgi:hypothetical protein
MVNMIYSKKEDKFFAPEFKDSYVANGIWPVDGIEVSTEDFEEFSSTKDGYSRKFENGSFSWEVSPISEEQLREMEISWRNLELKRADEELNKVQDSDPKAIGTVAQWRDYRKLLRAWPDSDKFPNSQSRPKSP